ncbi:MAG: hypothetical protein HKN04_02525 [Rhodothermaceae bacterium]|nr:hypothetical protein [Rhodothermaceae bacterium]
MADHPARQIPNEAWPELPTLDVWQDTCATLHLWTQIVGKIRLAQAPLINHWWNAALYVTPRGLTTSAIPHGARAFHIDFDFVGHTLRIGTSEGAEEAFALETLSVAAFYRKTMAALDALGLDVTIWPVPVELPEVIPFEDDEQHASYDADAVHRFWRALVQADRVFTDFRARFLGKTSPSHFFWGAFDLAVTRFSGRTAPPHPGGYPNIGDFVMQEAYSHEVASAGFWPGTGLGEAAFYAYAYPALDGFSTHPVAPDAAYFHADLGEFVLPYEAVRTAHDPDAALLAFLQTTYEATADLADWDRDALERTG